MASRLSFFLWSSIPDEELLGLAAEGHLSDPPVLAAQIARMLTDPKAGALVDNFGGQWLHLRNVAGWTPDPERFADFDESLSYAFERETALFLDHLIREDRSVLELIDADYTFLNERLAGFYGIDGVDGGYFRRVPLSGTERGGILTHGSVLMVTSYPTRTSPVLRGKWVLENLLGAPPPAAAARRPGPGRRRRGLGRQPAGSAGAAPRQPRLRRLPREAGPARIRAGELRRGRRLPDGGRRRGSGSIRSTAGRHPRRRTRRTAARAARPAVTSSWRRWPANLLTYAIGRGLESYDQPAVREISAPRRGRGTPVLGPGRGYRR